MSNKVRVIFLIFLNSLPSIIFAGGASGTMGVASMISADSYTVVGDSSISVLSNSNKLLYLLSSDTDLLAGDETNQYDYLIVSSDMIASINSTIGQDIVYTFVEYGLTGEWLPVDLESLE